MKYIKESKNRDRFDKEGDLLLDILKGIKLDLSKLTNVDIKTLTISLMCEGNDCVLEDIHQNDHDLSGILRDEYVEFSNNFSDMYFIISLRLMSSGDNVDEVTSVNMIDDYIIKFTHLKNMINSLVKKGYDMGKLTEKFDGFEFKYNISTYLDKADNLFRKLNGE